MKNYVSQDCVLTQAVCFLVLILERFVIFAIFENKYFSIEFPPKNMYRENLEKREGCSVVAHERLSEPRLTIEWLLEKLRSFSISLLFKILIVDKKSSV